MCWRDGSLLALDWAEQPPFLCWWVKGVCRNVTAALALLGGERCDYRSCPTACLPSSCQSPPASSPRNSSSPLLAVQTPLRKPVPSILSLGSNCWLPFPHLWWEKQIQLLSFSLHYGHVMRVFIGQAPNQVKTETSPWPSTSLKILQAEWRSLLERQINPVNSQCWSPSREHRSLFWHWLCHLTNT